MVTSRATRITLVTRYLIGRLTCERQEREFCTRPFKITELEKGRWSWISNCGEAFHIDSWLAEANPGHSDRDAILQALLPGPRTVVLFGPGKARMGMSRCDAPWESTLRTGLCWAGADTRCSRFYEPGPTLFSLQHRCERWWTSLSYWWGDRSTRYSVFRSLIMSLFCSIQARISAMHFSSGLRTAGSRLCWRSWSWGVVGVISIEVYMLTPCRSAVSEMGAHVSGTYLPDLALSLDRLNSLSSDLVRRYVPLAECPEACFSMAAKKMPNSVGTRTQPCLTPQRLLNASDDDLSTAQFPSYPHVMSGLYPRPLRPRSFGLGPFSLYKKRQVCKRAGCIHSMDRTVNGISLTSQAKNLRFGLKRN